MKDVSFPKRDEIKGQKNVPCILAQTSDPWKQVVPSFHQFLGEQLQLHPIEKPHIRTSWYRQTHSSINTYHSKILEWSCLLNVLQCLLQILQFHIHTALGLLSIFYSLCLESFDGLNLSSNIVSGRLECVEVLLNLVDNSLVLQDRPIVCEIDFGRLLR